MHDCRVCGATLRKRARVADCNGVAAREFDCPNCGAAGAIVKHSGAKRGQAFQGSLRQRTAFDGGREDYSDQQFTEVFE